MPERSSRRLSARPMATLSITATFALVVTMLAGAPAAQALEPEPLLASPAALTDSPSIATTSIEAAQAVLPAAVDLSQFNPELIIDDALFYDGNAMTAAEIQAFLDRRIGTCTNGRCLNVLRASISDRAASYGRTTGTLACSAIPGGTNLRVSEIIFRAQRACGISAKVILVTLEKEQGLVSSRAPSAWNIQAAMGAYCPDTAPCDPAFSGVGPQIIAGTTQLKMYRAGNFARQPGRHFIQYNPDASCGGTTLTIRNHATAALYNYTPYQPNASALRAGYGQGDRCASWGNRNFFSFYTSWFGSTRVGGSTGTPPANPAPARPTLGNIDTSDYVVALDRAGTVWGYPLRDGRWGARQQLVSGLGGPTRAVPIGDLTGDGRRDLLTTDAANNAYLRPGTGSGFGASRSLNIRFSNAVHVTAAGDFDGDGIPDVLTTDTAGRLFLWRGTPAGTLSRAVQVGHGWDSMRHIAGGTDIDGDGRPDLLAIGQDGRLWSYPANGRGGFGPRKQLGHGFQSMTALLAAGDVTGDGVPDVVTRTASGSMQTFTGRRSSVSTGPVSGAAWDALLSVSGAGPAAGSPRPSAPSAPATPSAPQASTSRDYTGSGQPTVLALATDGRLLGYRANGRGGWNGSVTLRQGWNADDRVIALGDFNGDGRPDVGRIDRSGAFWLHRGTGTALQTGLQVGHGWQALDWVGGGLDFDGDGNLDVLARRPTGELMLYRGNGSGGWLGSTQVGRGWHIFDQIVVSPDFNGDGSADLIARDRQGRLWLYPTTGNGGWGDKRQIGHGWGSFTSIVAPGDFDGDGNADILARRGNGDLVLYRGSGTGGWKSDRPTVGVKWHVFPLVQ